ncbi:receptor-like serine/threonine-protein kinase At2g45590 [Syzygium oleosum]|uniref:receptor-like serine/threonine-protein kinase At2g45590 n=1 Tax=Syzygium oleosum TaxID=219896 RepID=UPI0024BAC3D3|nr:receptor-like serine/threonine-protein kinase At2g45590 [Syzygium oleosum]
MPSRLPPPPPPPPPLTAAAAAPAARHHRGIHPLLPAAALAGAASLSLVLLFLALLLSVFLYRRLSRARTAPADSKSPHRHHHRSQQQQQQQQEDHLLRRFSYSLLRRSTSSFSPSSLLGHGAFGSVHKALLPCHPSPLAVKLMSSPSPSPSPSAAAASDREFRNELSLAPVLNGSPHIVSIHGYSTNRRGNRLLLVYEFMQNRSLQDALFDKKCAELAEWRRRFDIAADVARGLEYLHHCCDPPVIHGDIKPSNVLLDSEFRAKIGDFGLARLKTEEIMEEGDNVDGVENGTVMIVEEDNNGSILEESESVATGCDEGSSRCCAERSPESCVIRVLDSEESPGAAAASPEMGMERGSVSEGCFDGTSIESGKDAHRANAGGGAEKKWNSRSNWWWRQDNVGGSESGRVKDYVMEWIGSEIRKERPKSDWVSSSPDPVKDEGSSRKLKPPRKQRKRWEWWASLDEERSPKKEKKQKPKEWWREEFCDELSKKTKKRRGHCSSGDGGEMWWQKDDDSAAQERKKRKSRSSMDWWMDGLSGELRNGRRNSQEWSCTSAGDIIPKSGGVSSTPSMRGTVCYIAPEYGGGGQLSEKCDVYSYGVLLLVLVSGRRPLQVTASPMAEFERANLISWARQLAQNGRLLDLLDSSIHSLNTEQALLCITIALLCLQRSPTKRPNMAEVVGMLSGEAEPPHLPFEFSPSPPSNFQFKSRKKAW